MYMYFSKEKATVYIYICSINNREVFVYLMIVEDKKILPGIHILDVSLVSL